jgi:hypothetical protein
MTRLTIALLLLVVGTLHGQEVSPMGEKPSGDAVKTAKEIIAQSESKVVTMPLHGYALIPLVSAGEAFIVPDSDDCVSQWLIAKGTSYEGFLVSKDKPGVHVNTVIAADAKYDRILVRGLVPGKSTIVWHAIKDGKSVIVDAKKFVVLPDKPQPDPPGPNPPPGPDPLPPIPGAGFRVLIVTETKDLSTLPSAQVQAMTAKEVTDYLDSHCVKDNNQPEYRRFDKDTDLSKASSVWQEAMNRVTNKDQKHPDTKYTSLPWILVTNGKTGFEGPLPANTASLMTLLKQYGGQ